MDLFLYGSLRDPALLATVVGRLPEAQPARLAGHAVRAAADEAFPLIRAEPGATAEGLLATGLSGDEVARLRFYEAGFSLDPTPLEVETAAGPRPARLFRADATEGGAWEAGAPWDFAGWRQRWGETTVATARAFMAEYGVEGGRERAQRRWPQLLVRGGAAVRARQPMPATLRRRMAEGDVVVDRHLHPYANYFSVEEYDFAWRRFDGSMSRIANRAVFISGDAVVVLPYDPVTDRVHLIEQFRPGPYARGDAEPWLVETVAGRVDGGETPEEAGRREAAEEAGLELRELVPGPSGYSSPGSFSEYLYYFIGLCDLPEPGATATGGLDTEDEDIRSHVVSYDRLIGLLESGEIDNGPLLILVLWLERMRPKLRAAAGVAG